MPQVRQDRGPAVGLDLQQQGPQQVLSQRLEKRTNLNSQLLVIPKVARHESGLIRWGASRPRPALPLRRDLRLQEFLRRFELGLELLLRDPREDRLAELEESAWVAIEDRNNLGPAAFGLEGVADRERER